MTPTAAMSERTLSPEVLAFAVENGVAPYLPRVVAMTRELFPQRRLNVLIEQDPELRDNRKIALEIDDAGMDEEEILFGVRQWLDRIVEHCPTTHTYLFTLLPVPLS